jgi:hypothetical protein
MRSPLTLLALVAALGMLAPPIAARPRPLRIWFTPAPGSLDMARLFQWPEEWPTARRRVAVFKFYQSQLMDPPHPSVGPNSYAALRAADAFRILTRVWNKRLAIEVGSVKEHYCTDDATGMNDAINDTRRAIRAVREAGGDVHYLALDEPFTSGRSSRCGGPDRGPTFTRLGRYVAEMRRTEPGIGVGLIEPYPLFGADQLLDVVRRMSARGMRPAFFHVDVDMVQVARGRHDVAVDLRALAAGLDAENIPFGVIFWGHSGDSDALYVEDALDLVRLTNDALPDLPDDVIFQSWAESRTGQKFTPTNLPEWGDNTHTALIAAGLEILRRPGGDR